MKKTLVLIFAALAFGSAQAAVLKTDFKIGVLAINGKLTEKTQKIDETHFQLPDGQTQILVQAEGYFKEGSNSKYFASKPYVITFDASKDAVLKMPAYTKRLHQVKEAFSGNSPKWQLTDESGNALAYTTALLPGKKGLAPYSDLEALLAKYNGKEGVIFEGNEAKDLEELAVSIDEKGKVSLKGDNLTQLKLWYTKATKAEKKAFRHWMLDQDM